MVPIRASASAESGLSSVRAVIFTGSTEVLWMVRVKVKTPPGSVIDAGETSLVRSTVGRTSVTLTDSASCALAGLPSLSTTLTAATF